MEDAERLKSYHFPKAFSLNYSEWNPAEKNVKGDKLLILLKQSNCLNSDAWQHMNSTDQVWPILSINPHNILPRKMAQTSDCSPGWKLSGESKMPRSVDSRALSLLWVRWLASLHFDIMYMFIVVPGCLSPFCQLQCSWFLFYSTPLSLWSHACWMVPGVKGRTHFGNS